MEKQHQLALCSCKGCKEEREAIRKQAQHPFYKRVDDFRDEIKQETLIKAASKYKEPFNPRSWTIRQLGKHAMAENYDQGNYIVGLMEEGERLEKENERLANENTVLWDFISKLASKEGITMVEGANFVHEARKIKNEYF